MPFRSAKSSEIVDQLRQVVTGSVLLPDERGYDRQRKPWLEVVDQHPSAIVNAQSIQDIIEAIRVARELDLPFGVQNTGHGIVAPCDQGILLRLSEMKDVSVDPRAATAEIGPGLLSGELQAAIEPHGLSYPSGQVSNVGVIGYTLGGGYGWLGRKVGAACSSMLSATVVLANGSVVVASANENQDLFWALRGGGGNFGVVASMTVRLQRIGHVFGGLAYYHMKDAPEVLRFYRDWCATLPNETSSCVRLMKPPPWPSVMLHLLSTETCIIGLCHTDLDTADELHQQIRRFKEPVVDDLKVRPYSEMAGLDPASKEPSETSYIHVECLDLTDEAIEGVLAIARDRVPPIMLLELQHLEGALIEEPSDDMAYTAPKGPFYFKMISPKLYASLETLAPITHEAVRLLQVTGEVSYNWLQHGQQHLVPRAFTPEKYDRLKKIKQKFDPANFFRLNLNIPPE